MIFDDYGFGGPELTQKGIEGFLHGYHKRIEVLGLKNTQVFVRKLDIDESENYQFAGPKIHIIEQ